MGIVDRKQGVRAIEFPKDLLASNPIAQLPAKLKDIEKGFNSWQSLAVEASIVTATSAALGAAIGAVEGSFWNDAACLKQTQSFSVYPWVQARNFAVITGVNAGISCVMRRIRGKDDVQSSMVAAFGSGALFSLVSGLGGPNQAANAVTSGLFFALVQGGLFSLTLGQKLSQSPAEDVETKSLWFNLGLQNYEKNFMKSLDSITLPLLTYSALRVVKIPPTPRTPILDGIQRRDIDQLLYSPTSILWVLARNLTYDMRHRPVLIGFEYGVGILKNLYARVRFDDLFSGDCSPEIRKRNQSTLALVEKMNREINAIERRQREKKRAEEQ